MKTLKREVWQANLYLHKNNLVYGTQGNVSGIDRKTGEVWIKPSGVAYEQLKENMITAVDLEGRAAGKGKLKPSVDTPHHVFLYRNIKEISGVCHTHSKFITVFSVAGIPVPVLTTAHADIFGREIPVTPYVDNTADNIGKAFLKSYRKTGCSAVILGMHGLFAVAESPEKSAFYALMAEYCAEVSYYAITMGKFTGRKIRPLNKKEIEKWYGRYHSARYGQKT